MIHPPDDRVSLAPFRAVLRRYRPVLLRLDLQAGATVAVFAVPQAMAFAMLAGLPPVHGLYAAVVMSIVAAIWGSSPYVNTGPTNSASLLTLATVLPFVPQHDLLSLVFQFTLLVGLIRVAMGLLRMGWLMRFVPEPAFLGYMLAVGLLIPLGQIHYLFGLAASHQPSVIGRLLDVFSRLHQANLAALAIGVMTVGLMQTFHRYTRRFPVALVVIVVATLAAHWLEGMAAIQVQRVRDIAPVPAGLPELHLYPLQLSLLDDMLPGALAVAVIGLIE
ncbi:MAG: SulP family inorganic anion transporter, partial [Armatimonadota bacterium]|nr:SulP family inorganic anion transporter [Armatimonadota bacterium]